jgi:putative ABC transport system permease protein
VITEVALALVLLIGAGLLFNSFLHIVRVDPGFNPDRVVVAQVIMGDSFTDTQRLAFARDVQERVGGLPGVTEAAVGVISPMAWFGSQRCCWNSRGITRDDGTILDRSAMLQPIGPRYFEALGARLRGTGFLAGESYAEPYPVIISDALATQLYGEAEPIGRGFALDDRKYLVRGVVSGLHQWGLDQATEAEVYLPYAAFGGMFDRLSILVRTAGDPVAVIPQVRDAIWGLQPSLPADDVRLLADQVSHTLAEPRFYSTLMGIFGLLALTLAAVGIYASMLYSVRQRTRELGIRLALGAKRQDILSMIVREAGRLGIAGLAIGTLGAAGLTRVLSAFLFGIAPGDPLTFLLAVVILGATILAAAWFPARRASRADALTILRSD